MKTKLKFIGSYFILFFVLSILFVGCNNKTNNEAKTQQEKDYRFARIYIDEGIYNMMKDITATFDSIDANSEFVFEKASAWDGMAKLLTGDAEALITPKDYTHYEDSIMQAFNIDPHVRMLFAYDALVFYVRYDSPLDSISVEQIEKLLFNKNVRFSEFFPKLSRDYLFVTNSHLSSEIVNLQNLVLKGKKEDRRIYYFPNHDSVITFVKENDAIGIGYLSQILKEPDLKPLRISFVDSTGQYIFPRAVHQANIVRRLYPYIVSHYIYVQSETKEAAMRLGRFLSKVGDAQRYFLNYGIAPAFAQIKLIDEVN